MRRSGLVNQLELGGEAVRAGVLQQAAHRVGVQVSDELADLPDLVGQHRFQGIEGLCAGSSGLEEHWPKRGRTQLITRGLRAVLRPAPPGICCVGSDLTWLSEEAELVASSCRAFMASSAAICLAAFLLGALTVGKVWFPMATQYWNLAGGERVKMGPMGGVRLAVVRWSSFRTCHFLAAATSAVKSWCLFLPPPAPRPPPH